MSQTIALTGATGFVGGHLLDALLSAGHRVRALCRRPGALADREGLTVVAGALDDRAALDALLQDADCVVHCAGLLQAVGRERFQAVNVGGTRRLVEAALAVSAPPRLLLISSMAAREPGLSHYAASKRDAEACLAGADERLVWQVLRPPAVYGPGDRATLPVFQQMLRGRILVPGGGGNRFSLLHVEDLTGAVLHLVEQGLVAGSVHELHDARDSGYSWGEFAATASRLLGRDVATQGLPRWPLSLFAAIHCTWARALDRPPMLTPGKVKEIYHYDWVARENLLERATTWHPQIGLEEGFVRTLAWYKAHGWL